MVRTACLSFSRQKRNNPNKLLNLNTLRMKSIVLLVILCFASNLGAQNITENHNQLSLLYGIGTGHWKDQSYSPLSYDLGSLQSELRLQHFTRRGHIWDFDLQGWAALLSTHANDDFETQLLGLDLKVSHLWKLGEVDDCRLYIGPRYKVGSQIITWEDDYELSSAYSYLSTSNFAASARIDYQNNRWNFTAEASLPLIATNSRPAYSGFREDSDEHILNYLFDNVEWYTPDKYFAPEVSLYAGYDAFPWLALQAKYEGAYTELNDGEKIAFATHQLMLGINFKF